MTPTAASPTSPTTTPPPVHDGPGVHQFVPMLHRRDAVGEHTRALRDALRAHGIPSRIYVELPDPETVGETTPYTEYAAAARPGDVLVYQLASASAMAGWLAARPERLVVNYHSVTPPECFARWHAGIARIQRAALADRDLVAPRADLGIADSAFNAAELEAAGCRSTVVVPLANLGRPPVEPDPGEVARLRATGGAPRWLSVGRLVPNKGHERTLAALFAARRSGYPDAELTVVGTPVEPSYAGALARFVDVLGLSGAVSLRSRVPAEGLAALYGAADVLVLLSEHEGFGVPLVEAMGAGVPIVARRAGAVAEVAGDAAVLLDDPTPAEVAAAVAGVVGDDARRAALVGAGRARLASLDLPGAADRLVAAVRALLPAS